MKLNNRANIRMRPLSGLQPSQLFINREKLEELQSNINFSQPEHIPPIPIKRLEGEWVMTDGHTRAYAASLAGLELIPTVRDEDELDWEAYRICVDWCKKAGITQISGLKGRVIDPDAYDQLWLARCKRMQDRLEVKRQ